MAALTAEIGVGEALWLTADGRTPDKEWDAGTCSEVAEALEEFGLRPTGQGDVEEDGRGP
jgi:hypothetical protein